MKTHSHSKDWSHQPQSGGNDLEIDVMTFNIHHGRGTDRKLNLERIAQVIQASNADLIGLNEVDRFFSNRSKYIDQVSWLAKYLQMDYAFGETVTLPSPHSLFFRQYGNAFLSRYPILFQENHLLTFRSRIVENRSILEVDVQLPAQVLKIYVTHLSLNPLIHRRQTNFMIEKSLSISSPFIMMGDWNMRPKSRAWRKITRSFADVCEVVGKGFHPTFPSFQPRFQLDYIFINQQIYVTLVEVIKEIPWASDHLPLKARLVVQSPCSFLQ
jgi:endonuclease/exonuclease/phosphatase family metal-dependent hydrolase